MSKKKWLSDKVGQAIVTVAKKSAAIEANTSCPCYHYQTKEPKEVQKLRKF